MARQSFLTNPGWPTFVSNHFIIEESGSQFLIVVFQPDLIDISLLVRQKSCHWSLILCVADPGWPTFDFNQVIIKESGKQFFIVFFQPDLIVL